MKGLGKVTTVVIIAAARGRCCHRHPFDPRRTPVRRDPPDVNHTREEE